MDFAEKYAFGSLISPFGGIIEDVGVLVPEEYEPVFEIMHTLLGDASELWPFAQSSSSIRERLGGGGTSVDPELAWVRAVVEALERYCSLALLPKECRWATARELGDAALDLAHLPRLSETELGDEECSFRNCDLDSSIRWVEGFSLIDSVQRLVPVALSHLVPRATEAENFSYPVSTGTAAHPNVVQAVVSAILEVIERDAIALTWLTKAPLPRIEPDLTSGVLRPSLDLVARSTVVPHFFDATNDLGVPTVYCVQTIDGHPRFSQTVACASGFDQADLMEKVLRECAACRIALSAVDADLPSADVADFAKLSDGALFMGKPERRSDFDFLLRRVETSSPRAAMTFTLQQQLEFLLQRLRGIGTDVCVVDLTTADVRAAGIWVVKAIIPGLMPFSSVQRARFLATPRLYDYARTFAPSFAEGDVNPLPQPFS